MSAFRGQVAKIALNILAAAVLAVAALVIAIYLTYHSGLTGNGFLILLPVFYGLPAMAWLAATIKVKKLRSLRWSAGILVITWLMGAAICLAVGLLANNDSANSDSGAMAKKSLVDTEIISAINTERQKVGSPPVAYNSVLVNTSAKNAEDAKKSQDYKPTNLDAYVKQGGYAGGVSQFVYPVRALISSTEFVNLILSEQSNKNLILDSKYKDVGVSILPVNDAGVSSVIVLYVGAPAPVSTQQPTRTIVVTPVPTIYIPPSIHCTSTEIWGTVHTDCY